ncbi:MAG: hypothetical protein WC525_10290 [Candidatus Thermoplasmatota archaeon]
MKPKLSIDPGLNGGFALLDDDGVVSAENMPIGMTDIVDRLREIKVKHPNVSCIMEKTGTHVMGNSASASVKFARHCGSLESTLYCLGIPTIQVPPQTWMKKLGALPKDKKDRKNKIKEMMAARYPHLRVTLKNADALGILTAETGSHILFE